MWPIDRHGLRIIETDYGRDAGWDAELDGRTVALLTDPRWDCQSQFWYSYRLTPLIEDPLEAERMRSPDYWSQAGLRFRNREFGDLVEAVAAGFLLDAEG